MLLASAYMWMMKTSDHKIFRDLVLQTKLLRLINKNIYFRFYLSAISVPPVPPISLVAAAVLLLRLLGRPVEVLQQVGAEPEET